jgi:hypothetical protein
VVGTAPAPASGLSAGSHGRAGLPPQRGQRERLRDVAQGSHASARRSGVWAASSRRSGEARASASDGASGQQRLRRAQRAGLPEDRGGMGAAPGQQVAARYGAHAERPTEPAHPAARGRAARARGGQPARPERARPCSSRGATGGSEPSHAAALPRRSGAPQAGAGASAGASAGTRAGASAGTGSSSRAGAGPPGKSHPERGNDAQGPLRVARDRPVLGREGPPLEHEQSVIFQPFEQLESVSGKATPGMGLGLAIVKDLVTTLGGRIDLESHVGSGSRFTVILPLRSSPSS